MISSNRKRTLTRQHDNVNKKLKQIFFLKLSQFLFFIQLNMIKKRESEFNENEIKKNLTIFSFSQKKFKFQIEFDAKSIT